MGDRKGIDLEETAQEYFNSPSPEKLDKLIIISKALIAHFAKKYWKEQIKEDLVQAGYEGLVKAINGYDPERGVRFTTYSSHWIMGEMRHEIRKHQKFEFPGIIAEVQEKVNKVIESYFKEKGTFPSMKIIAEETNLEEKTVKEALIAGTISLEELDLSRFRSLRHQSFQIPLEDKIILFKALNSISALQKRVLFLLFFQDYTQTEVAGMLNTNQRQVSRVKDKGLENLKKKLGEIV